MNPNQDPNHQFPTQTCHACQECEARLAKEPWWLRPAAAGAAIVMIFNAITLLDYVLAIFLWIGRLFS